MSKELRGFWINTQSLDSGPNLSGLQIESGNIIRAKIFFFSSGVSDPDRSWEVTRLT